MKGILNPVPLTDVSGDPDWPDEPCRDVRVVVEQHATQGDA